MICELDNLLSQIYINLVATLFVEGYNAAQLKQIDDQPKGGVCDVA